MDELWCDVMLLVGKRDWWMRSECDVTVWLRGGYDTYNDFGTHARPTEEAKVLNIRKEMHEITRKMK